MFLRRSRLGFLALFSSGVALGGIATIGAGCSAGSGLACGAGTHEEENQCVANTVVEDAGVLDGGVSDGSVPADSATSGPDANTDASMTYPPDGFADAGPPVTNGDACPDGTKSVCYGNHVFGCQLVNNGTHPVGTLWDVSNCNLLAGTCTVDNVGNALCTGGGYTPCSMRDDAGNPEPSRRCYSSTVLEICSGDWDPTDCTLSDPASVCTTGPQGAYCTQ